MMKKTHAPHQGKSLLLSGLLLALLLSGCSPMLPREGTYDSIQSSLQQPEQELLSQPTVCLNLLKRCIRSRLISS